MNVVAIIQLLLGLVTIHSSNGQAVPNPIVAALTKAWAVYTAFEGMKTGLVPPNSLQNDITDLEQTIAALSSSGVLPTSGPLGDIQAEINKFASLKSSFDAGQAVSLFSFSADGKQAHAYAAVDGGVGAAALGA